MRNDVEADLRDETLKWLERAERLFARISPINDRFADNISAYISDSHHFLNCGDLIRAFEAVIWAWAWMEIGLEMGLLEEEE
jgi:hypothetical protein